MNTVEAKLDQIDKHDIILNGDGLVNVGLIRRVDGVQASLEHIARDIAAVKRIGLAILTAVLITMAIAALKVAFTEHPRQHQHQHQPQTSTVAPASNCSRMGLDRNTVVICRYLSNWRGHVNTKTPALA